MKLFSKACIRIKTTTGKCINVLGYKLMSSVFDSDINKGAANPTTFLNKNPVEFRGNGF